MKYLRTKKLTQIKLKENLNISPYNRTKTTNLLDYLEFDATPKL